MTENTNLRKDEARAEIEAIARGKGTFTDAFKREAEEEARNGRKGMLQAIESSEEIREDLERALKIISTDLYTSRARFLMEVIQNADDNQYTSSQQPMVSITVFPRSVKIECNEDGFSKDNIQALCRTGRSSKRPGQGYTGEKGIGFKSVFKLAERAHICSYPYFFQLDQKRELGMITPQWDEDFFDDYSHEYQTTIVLDRICDRSNDFSSALKEDIEAIDPVLILFLRRIKRLHITLNPQSLEQPSISMRFGRLMWAPPSGITGLYNEDSDMSQFFYKHQITTSVSGDESRRPDVTSTDIVLMFPVYMQRGRFSPLIREHNHVFAYLPLADFGFKFIIQADFLTTSNRQSVDEDNSWNKNIADKIPIAFETAVNAFNLNTYFNLNGLVKLWPLYLDGETKPMSAYWRSITKNLEKHLSGAAVLKDRTGSIREPKSLMFLDWAHDRNGEPIFGHMRDYVSSDYPTSTRNALLSLGVTNPNWQWVCKNLHELHDMRLLHGGRRTNEWFSDLAKVILKAGESNGQGQYINSLRSIPLIPLADGTWRCLSSENDPIFFPVSLGTTIPPGLPLSLVDEIACNCPDRKKLFQLLGVKDCNIANVIERIFDYHARFSSATETHVVAQAKYLYKMREYLRTNDMTRIWFWCPSNQHYQRGSSAYADVTDGGKLRQLFSGYGQANLLHESYFIELDASEKTNFAAWLREQAQVALAPRLRAVDSGRPFGMHRDFEWLLDNKIDEVLAILFENRSLYIDQLTNEVKQKLECYPFLCKSGGRATLSRTFIPLPALVEKTQVSGSPSKFNFLTLPNGDPEEWKFLSNLGVGTDEGLDFYLWVCEQQGFSRYSIEELERIYLAIHSRVFWRYEKEKVRTAFRSHLIYRPVGNYVFLNQCIWHGPRKLSRKPALYPVYGDKLNRLFQEILNVPNMSSDEAKAYLEDLRNDTSTTMADVIDVYVYIQKHCADTFKVSSATVCIAIQRSRLEWKSPVQCLWSDDEFSENGLNLESKVAIRRNIERHAPEAITFFTDILKLPNAGIDELLDDLKLMQKQNRDDPERVYRLYERIQSCRRRFPDKIRYVFKSSPLVFLRGINNNQRGRWLRLEDCIWTRSVLQSKHALTPSLNRYSDLFRETLNVQNVTIDMLVTELLNISSMGSPITLERQYQYAKDLLRDIARTRRTNLDIQRLDGRKCWPCHTPTCPREFRSMGSFYVNDRQDLFDIFSTAHAFLDFDFETSKNFKDLLRNRNCNMFLSETVVLETEAREPLAYDSNYTLDLRARGNAIAKFFEFAECTSPYIFRPLLNNVEAWISADIKTHYTLRGITITKSEGGSSVKVSSGRDGSNTLKIYLSENTNTRCCALITDFPEQLIAALEVKPAHHPELQQLLHVPLASLKTLLIQKGITGGNDTNDDEETLVVDVLQEVLRDQSDSSTDISTDEVQTALASSVPPTSAGSTIVESTTAIRASVRSESAQTTVQPHITDTAHQPGSRPTIFRPTTTEATPQGSIRIPSGESTHERRSTTQPTAASPYNIHNRSRNRERLRDFARSAGHAPGSGSTPSGQVSSNGGAFDMSTLAETLEAADTISMSTPVQIDRTQRRQAGQIPNRNEEEMARDFEVGFLGEQFVYTLLHDILELPGFTGEENWTSSLRSRAGFSNFGCEISDFTYSDTHGALTRHFCEMEHPYTTPEWVYTACNNGNTPLYRLEVKSTTSQDPTTMFYMSSNQHQLAKSLRVTSATPSEIYVILRVSGLDALEDGARHQPRWRVYMDPFTCGEEGVLNFTAPTYAVKASR